MIQIAQLGGGFKYFLFSPLLGEDFQFDYYFSNGLKPPTRQYLNNFPRLPNTLRKKIEAKNHPKQHAKKTHTHLRHLLIRLIKKTRGLLKETLRFCADYFLQTRNPSPTFKPRKRHEKVVSTFM